MPATVTLEKYKSEKLNLDVNLSSEAGKTDLITITAASQSDSGVKGIANITVSVTGEDESENDTTPPADSDNDGVYDEDDAFPSDPNETVDTDNDGTGNNADTDDDNDGMPDEWEDENGLNPLVSNPNEDPDNDGKSNIQEYNAGTNPTFSEPRCEPEDIDLNTWTQEGNPENGKWVVADDGKSVVQMINGYPTYFVSPESFIDTAINGKFKVETTVDDDFVGFIFGFKDINDFYLFSWKQGNQGSASEGFVLSHVTQDGNVPVDHQNTHDEIGYEVLLTKLGKEWGWANKTAYEFTLNYRTNHIRIDIAGGNFGAGQTIFELDGTFEEGRFGFYNRSQGNVRYEGFTQKCISDAPVSTNFEAGVFTVGNTGIVKIDWLFDGGVYQGELGIFSLSSMENLEPNSPEFIAEAVKRALSNSELGYIVLSDPTEGARFSGTLGNSSEPDRNSGVYKGLKSFKMKQGDKFATILVPNSTFNELAKNPGTENTHVRPIFSISSPNPEDRLYFGQLAKIHDIGNAFVFEDMLLSSNSDRDYNDLIIQIKGATVYAPTLDNPALGLKNDWETD